MKAVFERSQFVLQHLGPKLDGKVVARVSGVTKAVTKMEHGENV